MSGVFDTVAGLQLATSRAFRGADTSRLYSDRWVHTSHPDSEIRYAARTLRAASRDLVRNNPYAAGAVEAAADNIIGWEGIVPRPKLDDKGERRELVRGWTEWGDEYATLDGVESWFELQRLLVKSWFTDGEVFLRHRRGWDNPYGFAVEMIDPDLLDADFNERREERGREIIQGVEVDEYGRPLAYHFWRHHPDDIRGKERRIRVPADEVTHFFVRYRSGQTRGFSVFAPVLTTVEMWDGYTEAELVAARYHASKMGFLVAKSPDAVAAWSQRMALKNQGGKEAKNPRVKLSPGSVEELIPGYEFQGFDPNHPNDAFAPFLTALARGVARGIHMSYQTFTGDVSDANYSNTRAGMIPERDHWKAIQNTVSRRVHRPVWRDFVRMGLLTGGLSLRSNSARTYWPVEWRARRWQWVDPENDINTLEKEISLGLNSRQRAAAERGLDYETVIEETAEDEAFAEGAKVDVSVDRDRRGGRDRRQQGAAQTNGNSNGSGVPQSRLAPYGG